LNSCSPPPEGLIVRPRVMAPSGVTSTISPLTATVGRPRMIPRAAVVAEALEREVRRALAERDAAILCQVDEHDEMDALAAYAARVELDDLE
jgi:hypothetical protein